jgi:hypothetical protein
VQDSVNLSAEICIRKNTFAQGRPVKLTSPHKKGTTKFRSQS